MTEADWLKAEDPESLLNYLGTWVSTRRMRLVRSACFARFWGKRRPDGLIGQALDLAEQYADALLNRRQLVSSWQGLEHYGFEPWRFGPGGPGTLYPRAGGAQTSGTRGSLRCAV